MTVNKAILVGRLGGDPELKSTQNGTSVCNLSVATHRKYESRGETKEETTWHRVVVWGSQAEACDKYLSKGRRVYVEGRLQTNEWEDRDGNEREDTEINAQTVQFLGGDSGGGTRRGAPKTEPSPSNPASQDGGDDGGGWPDEDDGGGGWPDDGGGTGDSYDDDDVPF